MDRLHRHPILPLRDGVARVAFSFDGAPLEGLEGEPISTALAAAGIRVFSRHSHSGQPQGLFCANGQCSQCSLLVDGVLRKACVTPLRAGQVIVSPTGLSPLPADDEAYRGGQTRRVEVDVLVVGGGPAGLSACAELSGLGLKVLLADDKEGLGGKLLLQTHKFFGSEADCYAGTRGFAIAQKLEAQVRSLPGVTVLSHSPVVGIFKDGVAGVYEDSAAYLLVGFKGLLVAAGAREKSVLFPGNDLPGVFGAGAFQTLVNRDLVKPSRRVLILGSGNVGLIAAYHALQAGIEVVAIVDILPKVGGYEVHADKIRRLGVPILLGHGMVSVEGESSVERATIARVDSSFRPLLETAVTYEVDTVLVATGLSPCDELHRQARSFGLVSVTAGDAEEIAEASSAMFGGRIAALSLAKLLGSKVDLSPGLLATREVLKSRPGDRLTREVPVLTQAWQPIFSCVEEIPCNPCTTVCPTASIKLRPRRGSLLDLPHYEGSSCSGCSACVAICPGLAVSLARLSPARPGRADLVLPWELEAGFEAGSAHRLLDKLGGFVEEATLLKKSYRSREKTWLLTFDVSPQGALRASGLDYQAEAVTRPLATPRFSHLPDRAILCRCEGLSVGEVRRYIEEHDIKDLNHLKSLRVAMGACGSKTCSVLLPQVFRQLGRDPQGLAPLQDRPLGFEVSMGDLANEGGRP